MKKTSILLISILFLSVLIGQPRTNRMPRNHNKSFGAVGMLNMPQQGSKSQRMEMMMAFKLTEDLGLTPEQADKFFPRMKVHRENMKAIDTEIVSVTEKIRQKVDNTKEISNEELDKVLNEVSALEKQKVDERDRFIVDVKDVLNTQQRAKLAIFKHSFMKDLQQQIRRRSKGRT